MLHVENDNANASTYYLNTDAAVLIQNKNSNATAKTVLKLEGPVGGGDCAIVYGDSSANLIFSDRQNERLRIKSDGAIVMPDSTLGLRFGSATSQDFALFHSGSNSHIEHFGTGNLLMDFNNNFNLRFFRTSPTDV